MSNQKIKYIVVLGDGMADYPIESLGYKTPLEASVTPFFDSIAQKSRLGLFRTVSETQSPGSDIANLSVMGYDPDKYHTGRSPLEAASLGLKMSEGDTTFRLNLVTLSGEEAYFDKSMLDYSAGEITTAEAEELVAYLNEHLSYPGISFHTGTSYRQIMLWDNAEDNLPLTPPHDISGRIIKDFLPKNPLILEIMQRSYELLKDHPVNLRRMEKGLNPANSAWLWGQGKKTTLPAFEEKTGLKGVAISAVDLIKGIAKSAKMASIDVDGATGNVHTNFQGKADASIKALLEDGYDFLYLHIEAPDESGHHGSLPDKLFSIEKVDVVASKIAFALESRDIHFRMLICPDHPTPLSIKTHTKDPVPFMLFDSRDPYPGTYKTYDEKTCLSSGILIDPGYTLIDYLIQIKKF